MISGEQPGIPTSQTRCWGPQGLSQELGGHQDLPRGPNLPASAFTSHMAKLLSAPSPVSYLFLLFCVFLLSPPPAPPRCLWIALLSSQNCPFHCPDGQTLVPALLRRELQRGESSVGNVGQRGRRRGLGLPRFPLPAGISPAVWPDSCQGTGISPDAVLGSPSQRSGSHGLICSWLLLLPSLCSALGSSWVSSHPEGRFPSRETGQG